MQERRTRNEERKTRLRCLVVSVLVLELCVLLLIIIPRQGFNLALTSVQCSKQYVLTSVGIYDSRRKMHTYLHIPLGWWWRYAFARFHRSQRKKMWEKSRFSKELFFWHAFVGTQNECCDVQPVTSSSSSLSKSIRNAQEKAQSLQENGYWAVGSLIWLLGWKIAVSLMAFLWKRDDRKRREELGFDQEIKKNSACWLKITTQHLCSVSVCLEIIYTH